jgi:hypothetical protein
MQSILILFEGLNPEPWKAPDVFRGRGVKNADLRAYQMAVQELLGSEFSRCGMNAPAFPKGQNLDVCFWFWRHLASYKTKTGRNSMARRADATNMQKSTEDALQGILFDNDRDNRSVCSHWVEQGPDVEPAVLISIRSSSLVDGMPSVSEGVWMRSNLSGRNPGSMVTIESRMD